MGGTDLSVLPQRQVVFPETVFRSATASDVPLRVQGIVSQTGNLQEWRNASGTVLASIEADGDFVARQLVAFGAVATNIPLFVQGSASQSADLASFRNSSGTVLTHINNGGNVKVGPGGHPGGTWLSVSNGGPGDIAFAIRGAASQTANLQEWQNNAGTILGRMDPSGNLETMAGHLRAYKIPAGFDWGNAQFEVRGSNTTGAASSARIAFHVPGQAAPQIGTEGGMGDALRTWNGGGNGYAGFTAQQIRGYGTIVAGSTSSPDGGYGIVLTNRTAPTANVSGGGYLFCENGQLKYRGELGTVTVLAGA